MVNKENCYLKAGQEKRMQMKCLADLKTADVALN